MSEGGGAELLGVVTVPSGTLLLVDAGLLGIWEGTRADIPDTVDFRIDGPDAEEAGRRFDRAWHPPIGRHPTRQAATPGNIRLLCRICRLRCLRVPVDPYGSRIDSHSSAEEAAWSLSSSCWAPVFEGLPVIASCQFAAFDG